ncbi:MAG TPA: hypothetical protein VKO87_12010, partial [Gemmatimonadaceae bacterium]|nr:hypothetical protein [Gemmatimonadaceae bacterium]
MSDQGAFSSAGSPLAEATVRHVIASLTEQLELGGVEHARRTAHDIITSLLDVPRSWGIGHADMALEPGVISA